MRLLPRRLPSLPRLRRRPAPLLAPGEVPDGYEVLPVAAQLAIERAATARVQDRLHRRAELGTTLADLTAGGLVTAGVSLVYVPAGLITAGVLVSVVSAQRAGVLPGKADRRLSE